MKREKYSEVHDAEVSKIYDRVMQQENQKDYVAMFKKLEDEISSLPEEEQSKRLIREIARWTTPYNIDDIPEDKNHKPLYDPIQIEAEQRAREDNPNFNRYIEEIRNLLWKQTRNETVPVEVRKILWNKSQRSLVEVVQKLLRHGYITIDDGSVFRYIADHFSSTKTGDYDPEVLRASSKQTLNEDQEGVIDSIVTE